MTADTGFTSLKPQKCHVSPPFLTLLRHSEKYPDSEKVVSFLVSDRMKDVVFILFPP